MHFDFLITNYFEMEKKELTQIINDAIDHSMSYNEYVQLMETLTATGDSSGSNKSESYVDYTKLNHQRMRRLTKTIEVPENIQAEMERISTSQTWLIVTESWCGDAAQIVPLVQKLADCNKLIDTRFVLRDEHLNLMDQFLTRGGRSIPKLIVLDKNFDVLGSWGPRPHAAQMLYDAWKKEADQRPYTAFSVELQKWYTRDRGLSVFQEMLEVIDEQFSEPNVDR